MSCNGYRSKHNSLVVHTHHALHSSQHDLDVWRATSPKARMCDFSLLDRNNGAGWDLVKRLVCERNSINRGRLSAKQALRHRYFFPEF